MAIDLEELDYRHTPLGELILRRRTSLSGVEVYEVKLDGNHLMSSLVNESEIALARLGLTGLHASNLDVVVGGLGLGYTAEAALAWPGLRSLLVIEYLSAVVAWHRDGLVPLGPTLTGDPRCRIVAGDFFALAAALGRKLDPRSPGRRFHAILLDIDHSPRSLLHPRHRLFYGPEGLQRLTDNLRPGGVFALWSADAPDKDFERTLADVFDRAQAHAVEFYNPLLDLDEVNTIYVARTAE
jgi:spermidine synthase